MWRKFRQATFKLFFFVLFWFFLKVTWAFAVCMKIVFVSVHLSTNEDHFLQFCFALLQNMKSKTLPSFELIKLQQFAPKIVVRLGTSMRRILSWGIVVKIWCYFIFRSFVPNNSSYTVPCQVILWLHVWGKMWNHLQFEVKSHFCAVTLKTLTHDFIIMNSWKVWKLG